jgi:hypothetical protein
MKKNLIYILIATILIFLGVILYFHYNINTRLKCPDEYANTDKGSNEYQNDLDKWTNQFYKTYPSATLSDWNKARYQFWVDNNCKEALRRYKEAKDGNADPNKMKLIEDTMQEIINKTN